jgi:hypothetical protein
MASHVGAVVVGGFPLVKEVVAEELGRQPRQAPLIVTFFPLSKESPGACR